MPSVPDNAVVNASPIIVLARIGRIDLLQALYKQIVIPNAVAEEIRAGLEQDPARLWLQSERAGSIRPVEHIDPVIAGWDLGTGKTEVLTWARRNSEFEAIVDDRAARNCALTLRIPVRGTLGIVLLAKQAGYLRAVKPAFDQLLDAGLRLDASVLNMGLKLAGED